MNDLRNASRWLAALLLAQMVVGPLANFALLEDAFHGPGGFLASAAAHAASFATAVLLLLALALADAAMAVVLWPVLRPRSERMALVLVLLGGGGIALAGLEASAMMSMLSFSQAYVATPSPDAALYETLRGLVGAQRNWPHLVQIMCGGLMMLAIYVALFRLRLAPRALAGFGILAALALIVAVTKPFFGGWVVFPLLAPIGIANLLLAGWLLWKPGFGVAPDPSR